MEEGREVVGLEMGDGELWDRVPVSRGAAGCPRVEVVEKKRFSDHGMYVKRYASHPVSLVRMLRWRERDSLPP